MYTHRLCTCGHLSDQSAKFFQSWVYACPTPNRLVGFYFCCGFLFPPPASDLKPLFHSNLHTVFFSKHFLFYSHFVIQTILGIIAIRRCVWWSKPHCSSHTFSCYPSDWRLWKIICCHRRKTDIQNFQLQDQAFKTRIRG